MNSFTRIGLPILLVVGVVFGITFVRMYSPDEPTPDGPKGAGSGKATARPLPLKFGLTTASPQPDDPPAGLKSLKYWDSVNEVGVASHFDFWCHNPHPQPVVIRVSGVNCQCAGVEMAPVPREAFQDYVVTSALAGGPLGAVAAGPVAAVAHAQLDGRLAWHTLKGKDQAEQTLEAADPAAGTQVGIIRLTWEGRGEAGPRVVNATLVSRLGETPGTVTTLEAQMAVVPGFDAVRREGVDLWASARELPVGELRENAEFTRTVYLLSATRRQLLYTVTATRPDPCITWTEPVPASPEEVRAFTDFIRPDSPARPPRSVYKVDVTVRERVEVEEGGKRQLRQLDLGLLDRQLTITAVNGGSAPVHLRGRVLGDVTFLQGAPDGRVDLGTSFPANQDRVKDVSLLAERAGLNLVVAEVTPNYLKAKLEPLPPIDGRNQWRLRVTVPQGSLYGSLPETSAIVLTTAGPNPRRLRLPVRGSAFDSGTPVPRI
jgi:hypothetical protein